MNHISNRVALWVWLFLFVATLSTSWLADHESAAGHWTVVLVLVLALLKGGGITRYFMGLNTAPRAWRIAFDLWLVVVTVVVFYFWVSSSVG